MNVLFAITVSNPMIMDSFFHATIEPAPIALTNGRYPAPCADAYLNAFVRFNRE